MTNSVHFSASFFVQGIPQPKGSAHKVRCGRRDVLSYKTNLGESWELQIVSRAKQFAPARPLKGPMSLVLLFVLERPKTVTREYPTVKPDYDKLARAVGDAITRAGIWHDDAQVIDGQQWKRYGEPSGVGIWVSTAYDVQQVPCPHGVSIDA